MEGLSTFYFSILLFAVVSFIWFVSFCHCVLCLHKQKSLCNWMAKLEKECPAMLFMLIWLLLFLSLLSNMIWEVCKLGKDGARVCQYGEGTRELICIQMNLARSKKESFIFEHLLKLFAWGHTWSWPQAKWWDLGLRPGKEERLGQLHKGLPGALRPFITKYLI